MAKFIGKKKELFVTITTKLNVNNEDKKQNTSNNGRLRGTKFILGTSGPDATNWSEIPSSCY